MRIDKYLEVRAGFKTLFDIANRNRFDEMTENNKIFLDDQMSAQAMTIQSHLAFEELDDAETSANINLNQTNANDTDTNTFDIANSSSPSEIDNHEASDTEPNISYSDSNYSPSSNV